MAPFHRSISSNENVNGLRIFEDCVLENSAVTGIYITSMTFNVLKEHVYENKK